MEYQTLIVNESTYLSSSSFVLVKEMNVDILWSRLGTCLDHLTTDILLEHIRWYYYIINNDLILNQDMNDLKAVHLISQ